MKLASYSTRGRSTWGIVTGDRVSDIGGAPGSPTTLLDAITAGMTPNAMSKIKAVEYKLEDIVFQLPVHNPGKILCAGRNYVDHVAEGKDKSLPTDPGLFMRNLLSMTPHKGPILRPSNSDKLDFEGELCVIIGKPGRYLEPANALDHVFGYTIFNDGSLRDFQEKYKAVAGKNFPSTGALGPWIVTADAIPDPAALTLQTRLNGKVMQQSTTDKMIFDIPAILSFISAFTELRPGDVIATGTPEGVGKARTPPVWMKPGDVVEVEISGIGVLRNPVMAE